MVSNLESFGTTHARYRSLKDELTAALPQGFLCKVRYVHSQPKTCDPLFSPPPGSEPEKTRLASHFLSVSAKPKVEGGQDSVAGVLVFGIEVLIYTTKHLTTIFVSKADSTGYLPQQRPSPVKAIATTFLQWLSAKERERHPSRELVISLFARSQSQYLFPGSAENPNKHVLDDRQLIKWWARVLDPIFPKEDECKDSIEADHAEYDGYITVPGYEGMQGIRQFLPPQSHSSGGRQHWKPCNPLRELAETRGISPVAPPRCLLPRFPDDPKARFTQDLDNEMGISEDAATISPSKRKSGKWNSIRDLDRFWEAMEFRQECSSGRVVGFLWLVIRTKRSEQIRREEEEDALVNEASQDSSLGAPSSDLVSQLEELTSTNGSPSKRRRKRLTGPIIPRQPRLKGGSSSLTASSDLADMVNFKPTEGLVLSKESYDKGMESMLHLDFTSLEVAVQSTNKWIAEVSRLCGIQTDWSVDVTGTAKPVETATNASSNGNLQVNDLGGAIRKKRKVEDQAIGESMTGTGEESSTINGLSSRMIRKKPKPATS